MAWPSDAAAASDLALLTCSRTRVAAGDAEHGFELPHRSIQEYFGAVAALTALKQQQPVGSYVDGTPRPADAVGSQRQRRGSDTTAYDLLERWERTKPTRVPRDAALAVLLADSPPEYALTWALHVLGAQREPPEEWREWKLDDVSAVMHSPSGAVAGPPDAVIGAASTPADDTLRHLTMALCDDSATSSIADRFVSAIAAGCEVPKFCEFLGGCVRFLPANVAPTLSCRGCFERAAAAFWEQAPLASVATVLGPTFWAAADAVTGGAQAQRALAVLKDAVALGRELAGETVSRACAAVAVLGAIAHFTCADHLRDTHSLLEAASASPVEDVAAEAVFARAVLDPLPSVSGTATSPLDLRQRLLDLAQPATPLPNMGTVKRAAAELARRFVGDPDVHADLKAAVQRSPLPPFVVACMEGHGIALISPEIAFLLFEYLGSGKLEECTRLALRLWSPAADDREIDAAIANRLTPLHVAADRGRADFVRVFCGYAAVDAEVADAVNARTLDGFTPLDLAAGSIECVGALLRAGAEIGRTGWRSGRTPLHCAADAGDSRVVTELLGMKGVQVGAVNEVIACGIRHVSLARRVFKLGGPACEAVVLGG
jgi:hypothetical protein